MRINILYGIIAIIFYMNLGLEKGFSQSIQIQEIIRDRIEASGTSTKITIGQELIHASIVLPKFYERRIYQPAWITADGSSIQVDSLINNIQKADLEGLRAEDYHLKKISSLREEILENKKKKRSINPGRLTDLELLCTDAFLIYGSHLLIGRIDPVTIDPEWFANRSELDLAKVLESALLNNQIGQTLQDFLPQTGYKRVRKSFLLYQKIDSLGGYSLVPDGPKLQKGDKNNRILFLRKRLETSGEIKPEISQNDTLFDDFLEDAVRLFQRRYGLDSDGIVGKGTLSELNIPAIERVDQLRVNLERWRWLPQNLGEKYILVNIANFELDVVENNEMILSMRVVVGKTFRRTPVFSDKVSYLVLNPYWNVPPTITKNDVLPEIRKNVDYLAQKNMKVFLGWGADTKEIDPTTVEWYKITGSNNPYRFRQEPGPDNVLGRIKFMFPNQFDIYLHDTPSRELFAKAERAFSSGCIRIEKPFELAEYLLRADPKWTNSAIQSAIDKKTEQTVRLPEPINVHLLYWTAWADDDSTIHFRKDIYGRDKRLLEALQEKPPKL